MREIKEIEKELDLAKIKLREEKNKEWNKKSEDWVKENRGEVYKNDLYFPDSKEKREHWVYKVAGIEKVCGVNEILLHQIYISDMAAKIETNKRIYSSCGYITHGMAKTNNSNWDIALERLLEIMSVTK